MKARILLLTLAAVVCCSSVAIALDPMGPPKASLGQGAWGWGVEVAVSEMDLIRIAPGGGTDQFDVDMNKIYVNLSRGLTDNIDVFVRLGITDFEYTRLGGHDRWKGDDSAGLAIGAGAKATFYEEGNLAIGGIAQFSHSEFDGKRTDGSYDSDPRGFQTDITEFQIAVGPTLQVSETVDVFGGLFLHYVDGDHVGYESSYSGYRGIEEDSVVGGYLGATIDISETTTLCLEYMDTGDAWAVAGGVSMPI